MAYNSGDGAALLAPGPPETPVSSDGGWDPMLSTQQAVRLSFNQSYSASNLLQVILNFELFSDQRLLTFKVKARGGLISNHTAWCLYGQEEDPGHQKVKRTHTPHTRHTHRHTADLVCKFNQQFYHKSYHVRNPNRRPSHRACRPSLRTGCLRQLYRGRQCFRPQCGLNRHLLRRGSSPTTCASTHIHTCVTTPGLL